VIGILWPVVSAIGFLLLLFLFAQYARPLIYDYALSATGLHVLVLHRWRIYAIRHDEIIGYRRLRLLEALTLWMMPGKAIYVGNRLFSPHLALVRERKPMIVITPADPPGFLRVLAAQRLEVSPGDTRRQLPPSRAS